MQPALTTVTPAPEVTYADLMGRTVETTERAIARTRHLNHVDSHSQAEVLGFAKFLRTAGRHILQLNALAPQHHVGLSHVAGVLGAQRLPHDVPASHWETASQALGATHDLLATHIGVGNRLHTPEVIEIFDHAHTGANGELLQLFADGPNDVGAWISKITWPTGGLPDHDFTKRRLLDLTQGSRELQINCQAVMWELVTQHQEPLDRELAGLTVATQDPTLAANGPMSAQAALRTLRHIGLGQARDDLPASANSLRDLTVLAARVTDPSMHEERPGSSGLDRLQHAHARDRWERAHQAWTDAGDRLTTTIRTLTKAPPPLRQAHDHLAHDGLSPALASTIRSALPRLAADAAETVRRLHRDGNLASYRRQLPEVRRRWVPADVAEASALAQRFQNAGTLTRQALASTVEPHRQATQGTPGAPPRRLARSQEVRHDR